MTADQFERKYSTARMWMKINSEKVKFWSDMSWMSDGKKLWAFIKRYKPTILTKPASSNYSITGKKIWIKRELGSNVPYIMSRDKYQYAEKGSILIDDQEDNIGPWIRNGGIGILHKNAYETIKKLKGIFHGINIRKQL